MDGLFRDIGLLLIDVHKGESLSPGEEQGGKVEGTKIKVAGTSSGSTTDDDDDDDDDGDYCHW